MYFLGSAMADWHAVSPIARAVANEPGRSSVMGIWSRSLLSEAQASALRRCSVLTGSPRTAGVDKTPNWFIPYTRAKYSSEPTKTATAFSSDNPCCNAFDKASIPKESPARCKNRPYQVCAWSWLDSRLCSIEAATARRLVWEIALSSSFSAESSFPKIWLQKTIPAESGARPRTS